MRSWTMILLLIVFPTICLAAPPGFMKERMGTLTGKILVEDGKPLAGGIVSFFNVQTGPPPLLPGANRIPDGIARVDTSGRFNAMLVPGTYYLGALLVTDPGRGPGPPQPGEKVYFAMDDNRHLRQFKILTKEQTDAGEIHADTPDKTDEASTYFTIEGRIIEENGTSYSNALVLFKDNPTAMRPEFASEQVAADGTFRVKLPAGTYYLVARQLAGNSIIGQPKPGSFIGTYGANTSPNKGLPGRSGPAGGITPPSGAGPQLAVSPATGAVPSAGIDTQDAQPVTGKAGETVKDITITVFPVARPEQEVAESYFMVAGTVIDKDGNPVAGMQVHAKEGFKDFRPPFTSNATDSQGRFTIELPVGKKYILLARPSAVGPPQPGTIVGFYGLTKPVKELLVFLKPDSPGYDGYFKEAKTVSGKTDEVVKDVIISVFPLGGAETQGMIPLPEK